MSEPNFDDAWSEPPRQPPRGRGRPPLKKVVRQEEIEEGSNPAEDLPLFAEVGETVAKIRVIRVEPHEGFLEDIPDPELAMAEIERRFGGGTFMVQAINERHKIVKTTRFKIAGDPIFKTASLQLQWDRQHGIKRESQQRQELSPIDMITFISEREAIRQDAEMKMQERLKQIQIEADARKRADDDERDRRRRADEDERERRREQQRREDEERTKQNTAQMLAMMQASHTQTLQFMQAQMQMQAQQLTAAKPAEGGLLEAIKTIAVIKETFAGEGAAEKEQPEDLMALLVKNGPSWLNAAGNAIGGAVREIKGGGAPALAPAPAQSTNLLAALPEPIAKKMETFVEKLVEKGHDPTVAVDKVLDHLIANTEALPVRGANPAEVVEPRFTPPQAVDVQGIARAEQAQQAGKVLPMKRNSVEVGEKVDGVVSVKFGKTKDISA